MVLAAASPSLLHDDISPQPLAQALDALAHQTGLQVIYVSSVVQGQRSGRAQAGMNAFEALAHLLEGTGLAYTTLTAASVRITAASSPAPGHAEHGAASAATSSKEEIVVTARYQSEPVWSVPLSLTVLTGEQLERQGISDLTALSLAIPGMSYTYLRAGGSQLVLRGLAPQDNGGYSATENNVATLYDGLYISNAYMVDMNMLDLQQIEVLRGPQNALVGRNAFAGAILYEPARPTAQFQSRAVVEGGSDGFARASGYVSGPLFDELTGRLAATREIFDGTIRNRADPAHNLGGWRRNAVSGALQWDAEGSLAARLSGFWYEVQRDATSRFPIGGEVPPPFNCGDGSDGSFDNYCGAIPAPESVDISPDARGQSPRTRLGRFELTWRGPSIQVTSLTGYVDTHSDSNPDDWDLSSGGQLLPVARVSNPDVVVRLQPANTYYSGSPVNDSEWSEDLRASGNAERWQWLAGVYGARNHMTNFGDYATDARGLAPDEIFVGNYHPTLTPLVMLPAYRQSQHLGFLSLYGSATWQATEDLEVALQLRWAKEKVDYLDGTPTLVRTYITPRYTGSYRVGRESQVYASAARGARSILFPGLGLPGVGSNFDTNWTYELGVKSGADGSPVAGSATAFLVNWDTMQLAGANAARVTGFELAADANPLRWLSLHALYAYTNAQYRAGTLDPSGSDIGGHRLPYAPLQAASLRATLHGSLAQQWQWSFDAGVDLVGSEYAGWDNLNWFESRQVWNFRCALAGERWEAALWARNLGVRPYSSFASFITTVDWMVVDRANGGYWGAALAYRFR